MGCSGAVCNSLKFQKLTKTSVGQATVRNALNRAVSSQVFASFPFDESGLKLTTQPSSLFSERYFLFRSSLPNVSAQTLVGYLLRSKLCISSGINQAREFGFDGCPLRRQLWETTAQFRELAESSTAQGTLTNLNLCNL